MKRSENVPSNGYRPSAQSVTPDQLHFCNKMALWLSCDGQHLAVCSGEREISLAGPVATLEMLRTRLLKQAGG